MDTVISISHSQSVLAYEFPPTSLNILKAPARTVCLIITLREPESVTVLWKLMIDRSTFNPELCHSGSWLLVYFGGLTFDQERPGTHLRIPNNAAAIHIASWRSKMQTTRLIGLLGLPRQRVCTTYTNTSAVLEQLRWGNWTYFGFYRDLMVQRDVTVSKLNEMSERYHRHSFYYRVRISKHSERLHTPWDSWA